MDGLTLKVWPLENVAVQSTRLRRHLIDVNWIKSPSMMAVQRSATRICFVAGFRASCLCLDLHRDLLTLSRERTAWFSLLNLFIILIKHCHIKRGINERDRFRDWSDFVVRRQLCSVLWIYYNRSNSTLKSVSVMSFIIIVSVIYSLDLKYSCYLIEPIFP